MLFVKILIDGNPLPQSNPSDNQNLLNEVMRHRNDLESARRLEKIAKQTLDDIQAKLNKAQAVAKNTKLQAARAVEKLHQRRNSGMTSTLQSSEVDTGSSSLNTSRATSFWVTDVLGALKRTAEKRREEANSKGNSSSNSAWLQSLPTVPNSLKKFLWYKMHRRKTQIILRPTEECLINEMKKFVRDTIYTSQQREPTDDEMIEAERVYLLATHPLDQEKVPSVPTSRSNEKWAEPGWMLNLDVPEVKYDPTWILPRSKSFPILERNLSEISSGSGRQASLMLHSSNLRCLTAPLSIFAKASSSAETNLSLTKNGMSCS